MQNQDMIRNWWINAKYIRYLIKVYCINISIIFIDEFINLAENKINTKIMYTLQMNGVSTNVCCVLVRFFFRCTFAPLSEC